MGKFSSEGNRFGKRGSARSEARTRGRDNQGGESGSDFVLHEGVCDKCGKNCDVPFKPTSSKPLYCRSCFRANNSGTLDSRPEKPRESFDRPERSSSRDTQSEELEKISRRLDKIMKALKINY